MVKKKKKRKETKKKKQCLIGLFTSDVMGKKM